MPLLYGALQKGENMDKTYRLVSRSYKNENTVVKIGSAAVGNGFTVIAGPCSVESREQIISTAFSVKKAGADILRGGVFKPRSSPYDFQGPGKIGFEWLNEAKKASCLPVVSEITDPSEIELFTNVDAFQVGARNMWNFELLKALGKTDKPVLLKRGPASRLDELLCAAEYIAVGGNMNIILCERGIRTFSDSSRFTLDLSAVPVLKSLTHLPVIVDPSHASGDARFVGSLACAAAACGCDGVMIESHINASEALCDASQAVSPEELEKIIAKMREIRKVLDEDR